jgi:hypothetical protein
MQLTARRHDHERERSMTAWIQCARCRRIWDDDNDGHEVCACLDKHGSRQVYELDDTQVYALQLIENTSTNLSA